jgi:hypothetical protein
MQCSKMKMQGQPRGLSLHLRNVPTIHYKPILNETAKAPNGFTTNLSGLAPYVKYTFQPKKDLIG